MVKVSILVPVYNVESYLRTCLDSIINQTLKEIEIICINDGSTDNSKDILDEYSKKDLRLKVIHKKNTGYGDSLNIGLSQAIGKYIAILESDDFVEQEAYGILYDYVEKYNLDCIKSDYWEFQDSNKKVYHSGSDETNYDIVFSNTENMCKFNTQSISIWAALYKRSFLEENNIKFLPTPGASYQDVSFWFKTLVTAKRSYFINKALFNYRTDNSNSSVKSREKVYCICEEIQECKRFLLDENVETKLFYPYLVKIMYLVYIWNMNRISWEYVNDFVLNISKEWIEDKQSAYLKKELFFEYEWREFNFIAEFPDEYFQQSIRSKIEVNGCNKKVYINGIIELIKKEKNIYIYGAGKMGDKIKKLIRYYNDSCNITYVVTEWTNVDVKRNVFQIDDAVLDKDVLVILSALHIGHRMEMLETAMKNNFKNIYIVDEYFMTLLSKNN